jgi:hypothetical protein
MKILRDWQIDHHLHHLGPATLMPVGDFGWWYQKGIPPPPPPSTPRPPAPTSHLQTHMTSPHCPVMPPCRPGQRPAVPCSPVPSNFLPCHAMPSEDAKQCQAECQCNASAMGPTISNKRFKRPFESVDGSPPPLHVVVCRATAVPITRSISQQAVERLWNKGLSVEPDYALCVL